MLHLPVWYFTGSARISWKYFGLPGYLWRKWWFCVLSTMSHLWMILTFIICGRHRFLRAEERNSISYFNEPCSRWPFCVFTFNCLTLFTTPFPPICQRRVLVPEAAVVQPEDLTAHYVSPPLKSDRGEKYVNQDTVDFSHVPPVPSLTIFIHRPCLATVTYNDPFC